MARDYKHRAQPKQARHQSIIVWWKWLLVFLLISVLAGFLFFLRYSKTVPEPSSLATTRPVKPTQPAPKKPKPQQPQYDFYTLLPKAESVVPDYEIKTRVREEKIGKAKATRYIIQAGSFKDFAEADRLKARLALMGLESKVEKAIIGSATWHRVKMGPFNRSSTVSIIQKRLKDKGIDAIVTELRS